MKGFKEMRKLFDFIGIDPHKTGMLGDGIGKDVMMQQIENEINSQIKDVQKTTAKKII